MGISGSAQEQQQKSQVVLSEGIKERWKKGEGMEDLEEVSLEEAWQRGIQKEDKSKESEEKPWVRHILVPFVFLSHISLLTFFFLLHLFHSFRPLSSSRLKR